MSQIILAQQASVPSTPASGKDVLYVTNDSPPRFYALHPDGTVTRVSPIQPAFSTATVSAAYAADTYLVGSKIAIPNTLVIAGATYRCRFDMVKTAAGTAQATVIVRIGTNGSTADAAILTFTFAAGTAAADTGLFEIVAHFRTVGSGTSAVMVGLCNCSHALAATGLISTGASGYGQLSVVSSGFNSTPANQFIGVSFNGGASFSGTSTLVEAELLAA